MAAAPAAYHYSAPEMTSQGPINPREKLPWGWHFSPTDVELVNNLRKKVQRHRQEMIAYEPEDISDVLRDIDLSDVEPWEIKNHHETCGIRAIHKDEQNQYFYTQKEQKYRNGSRSNRATRSGFWKATGRDKTIYSKMGPRDQNKIIIGYRKALVFYQGRAPNGTKTDWILHEFRLENGPTSARDEQWVACHMFIKERNGLQSPSHTEPEDLLGDLEQQQQQQEIELSDANHNHQGIKAEPAYPISFSDIGPSQQYMDMSQPEQDHLRNGTPSAHDDLSLPRLEEEVNTYPVDGAHLIGTTAQLPVPTTERLPSFDDPLYELLCGIRAEQTQHLDVTFDSIWST